MHTKTFVAWSRSLSGQMAWFYIPPVGGLGPEMIGGLGDLGSFGSLF